MIVCVFSCGKKDETISPSSKEYWDDKRWAHADDDGDGRSNLDELTNDSVPEILSIPDIKNLKLTNVLVRDPKSGLFDYEFPLTFETSSKPFITYIENITHNNVLPKSYFYERSRFEIENIVIKSDLKAPLPNELYFSVTVNDRYSLLLKKFFFPNNNLNFYDTTKMENFSLVFEINIPRNIEQQSLHNIEGIFLIEENQIPWKWNVRENSQNRFQVDISPSYFFKLLKQEEYIKLKVESWQYKGPKHYITHTSSTVKNMQPFYILTSKTHYYGWAHQGVPSIVYKIFSHLKHADFTSPWSYLKSESSEGTSSLWLKEQNADNGPSSYTFKVELEDLIQGPLPSNDRFRGVKILAQTEFDYGVNCLEAKYRLVERKCIATFPNSNERKKISTTSSIELNNFLNRIIINGKSLDELISEGFAIITNPASKENPSLREITLYWPKNFNWKSLSIKGHKNDVTKLIYYNPENCEVENAINLPKSYQYIYSTTYQFNWIY